MSLLYYTSIYVYYLYLFEYKTEKEIHVSNFKIPACDMSTILQRNFVEVTLYEIIKMKKDSSVETFKESRQFLHVIIFTRSAIDTRRLIVI